MPVEPGRDRLKRGAVQADAFKDRIGRHDAGHTRRKGSVEGGDMFGEAGVVQPRRPPIDIMPIKPLGLGPVSDPVFDDGRDAVRPHAVRPALETFHIGLDHPRHIGGV